MLASTPGAGEDARERGADGEGGGDGRIAGGGVEDIVDRVTSDSVTLAVLVTTNLN